MDFIIETLGKLFKRLMIFIGLGIIYKIIEFIFDLCDNSIQELAVIVSIICLTLVPTIIFFSVRSRKKKKIHKYATTLKTELKNLEEAKATVNKIQIDILKNQVHKIDKNNKKLSITCAEILKENIEKLNEQKYQYDKKYLTTLLTDDYINEIIDFPRGIIYRNNKLEDLLSSEIYGRFTAYIAPHGKVIHFKQYCSNASIPINITESMCVKYKYSPVDFNPSIDDYTISWESYTCYDFCQKCGNRNKKYFFQMPKWYEQYLKVKKLKEHYNIE